MRSTDPRHRRNRKRAEIPSDVTVAPQLYHWTGSDLFTQCSPRRKADDIEPRTGDKPLLYTRAHKPLDLHLFPSAHDVLVEWAERKVAQMDWPDGLKTIAETGRRVTEVSVMELIVVMADAPKLLKLAEVPVPELDLENHLQRHKVAETARMLGVGGIALPPGTRAGRPTLVVFAPFIAAHVTFLDSELLPVPLFGGVRQRGSSTPAAQHLGQVIDFPQRQADRSTSQQSEQ